MHCKLIEWDYILKTIKGDCYDMQKMGLISLASTPLLWIHRNSKLKEVMPDGPTNAVAYGRREWSLSFAASSSAGVENISLSYSAFFASLNLQTCPTFVFLLHWTPVLVSRFGGG